MVGRTASVISPFYALLPGVRAVMYALNCHVLRTMYTFLYCVLCTLSCTAYYEPCPVLHTMNEYENCPIVCTMYTGFTAYYMHTVLCCVLHAHCPVLRTTCTLSCTAYYMYTVLYCVLQCVHNCSSRFIFKRKSKLFLCSV